MEGSCLVDILHKGGACNGGLCFVDWSFALLAEYTDHQREGKHGHIIRSNQQRQVGSPTTQRKTKWLKIMRSIKLIKSESRQDKSERGDCCASQATDQVNGRESVGVCHKKYMNGRTAWNKTCLVYLYRRELCNLKGFKHVAYIAEEPS